MNLLVMSIKHVHKHPSLFHFITQDLILEHLVVPYPSCRTFCKRRKISGLLKDCWPIGQGNYPSSSSLSFIFNQSPSFPCICPYSSSPLLLFSSLHLGSYQRHPESRPFSSLTPFQSIHRTSINELIVFVKHKSDCISFHLKTFSNFPLNVFRKKFSHTKFIMIWPRCCRHMYFVWPHSILINLGKFT